MERSGPPTRCGSLRARASRRRSPVQPAARKLHLRTSDTRWSCGGARPTRIRPSRSGGPAVRLVGTEWVLLSRCPSIGHGELLLAALRKRGLGGETAPHGLEGGSGRGLGAGARNAAAADEAPAGARGQERRGDDHLSSLRRGVTRELRDVLVVRRGAPGRRRIEAVAIGRSGEAIEQRGPPQGPARPAAPARPRDGRLAGLLPWVGHGLGAGWPWDRPARDFGAPGMRGTGARTGEPGPAFRKPGDRKVS